MNIRRGPPGRMGRTAAHLRVDCTGPGLSAFGATATEVERVLLRLLARLGVEDDLAYRYPAIVANVGRVVGRWVWFGCGRVLGVHWGPFPLGRASGELGPSRGGFLRCQQSYPNSS